ncbi:hypothetical protein BDN70DRAFT_888285 [Pholiota conissans]|uniref:Histone deacetylase complex subunit SAP30 Sin3 binding domain-containing protein n=1 Tax=Pholiota conissans TaxID=109636 RepID=A0A9P6CLL7_9AGAR|nr:hypothetical protein BDN70DRAFT_888285 [Pholiota conissans]
MSASAPQVPSSSRSRTQARKKVNDDASYFGPPSSIGPSGTKRQAADKVDGEQSRAKRKRVENTHPVSANTKKDAPEAEPRKSLVEFHKMSTNMLYRYMIQFDILPSVYPSPLTAENPPPPLSLVDPQRQHSRAPSPPTVTPANRPRRDPKDSSSRTRSSRVLEEDPRSRTPILTDVDELHGVLASIVERHFRETTSIIGREEVDTLAAFMCAVEKSKDFKARGS